MCSSDLDDFKQEVVKRYNNFLLWVKENNFNEHVQRHAQEIVSGVLNYMRSESYYEQHWNEFVKYTIDLDRIRDENINDVEPEFKKYL